MGETGIVERTFVWDSGNLTLFPLMPYSRFTALSKFSNLFVIQLLNKQAGVFQREAIWPSRGYLVMYGDIFDCHDLVEVTGI